MATERRRVSSETRRAYRLRNYERVRAQEKASRARNIEKHRRDTRERMRKLRAANPEKYAYIARKALHKNKYGMTLSDRNAMLAAQGGCCAICGTDKPGNADWHTDHCHVTHIVRGLLCQNCNLMLGHAKDSIITLLSALSYLRR